MVFKVEMSRISKRKHPYLSHFDLYDWLEILIFVWLVKILINTEVS